MKPRNLTLIGIVLFALLNQGCAHKAGLYYWGNYEDIVYDIYLNPGEADVQTQLYRLNETIERAENNGMRVPPGLYAHLGMVYAQAGEANLAREALLQEKALFPESSVFIDGILSRSKLSSAKLNIDSNGESTK